MHKKYFMFTMLLALSILFSDNYGNYSHAASGISLKWKKILKIETKQSGVIHPAFNKKFFHLFYSNNGYYSVPLNNLNNPKSWKYFKYPLIKIRNSPFNIGNVNALGDEILIKCRQYLFIAKINEVGEFEKLERQFYEIDSSRPFKFIHKYNRLYFLSYNSNAHPWYGITTFNTNMTLNSWRFNAIKPKVSIGLADASIFNGFMYWVYGDKTGVLKLNEDGIIDNFSYNATIPKGEAKNVIGLNGMVYLFTNTGMIYGGNTDKNGTIYEWNELGRLPIKTSDKNTSRIIHNGDSIFLFYSYSRRNPKQKALKHYLDIYKAKVQNNNLLNDNVTELLTYQELTKEKIIKPESKIHFIKYLPNQNILYAWDATQNRMLVSKNRGKGWNYSKLSFSHDDRDSNSKAGRFIYLDNFSKSSELLVMLHWGIYKADSEFIKFDLCTKQIKNFYSNSSPNTKLFAIDPFNNDIILYGAKYKSGNYGKNWLRRGPEQCKLTSMMFLPKTEGYSIAACKGYYHNTSNIIISTNHGDSWRNIGDWAKENKFKISDKYGNISKADNDPIIRSDQNDVVYVISPTEKLPRAKAFDYIKTKQIDFKNKIYKNYLFYFKEELRIKDAIIIPGSKSKILIATDKGLFSSNNGGINYRKIINEKFYALSIDSNDSQAIWAGGLGKFYFSKDFGNSWAQINE